MHINPQKTGRNCSNFLGGLAFSEVLPNFKASIFSLKTAPKAPTSPKESENHPLKMSVGSFVIPIVSFRQGQRSYNFRIRVTLAVLLHTYTKRQWNSKEQPKYLLDCGKRTGANMLLLLPVEKRQKGHNQELFAAKILFRTENTAKRKSVLLIVSDTTFFT